MPASIVDLVRPRDDHLVGARDTLARGESRTGIDDHGVPAERSSEGAERFGDVAGPDGHEPRWWPDRLDEHAPPVLFAQFGACPLVGLPTLADAFALDDDVARTAFSRRSATERLEEDVDLTAAGQPDRPGLLVGDAVRHDTRELAVENRLAALGDVGLDTAARDRPEHPAGAGHRELRAQRARGAAAGRDDGRDRYLLACCAPFLCLRQNVVHRMPIGHLVSS